VGWPEDWQERVDGTGCRFCAEGRPQESALGLLIQAGEVSDAYLARRAMVRGYAVVIWRGRHVVEPHDLSAAEAARFHAEVLRVGAALEHHLNPLKINYMTMGNRVPHLHTHVTARYRDDPAPGSPLPDGPNHDVPPVQLADDAAALRLLLR
jgi:diadenosine tetraphosphate (Ap4A) HIT family hydrolase